ncbi:hypothetical protein HK405_002208 [Cladochytrium tenue]|nr:hypothetical protein HK405_002208 [Cladochytrium tenue]
MFELVAPVSYVDYRREADSGHLRFKTAEGAQRAVRFFGRQWIAQSGPRDSGTLRAAPKAPAAGVDGSRATTGAGSRVTVKLLERDEEREYWRTIRQAQDNGGGGGQRRRNDDGAAGMGGPSDGRWATGGGDNWRADSWAKRRRVMGGSTSEAVDRRRIALGAIVRTPADAGTDVGAAAATHVKFEDGEDEVEG